MLFFTYWEGDQFSFFHYMTIFSLRKLNPNSEIIIYTSNIKTNKLRQWLTHEHSVEITKKTKFEDVLDRAKLEHIDFENEYGIKNDISVTLKADFTRIVKLYEHGGVWFDFDILFIKPVPKEILNSKNEFIYYRYDDTVPTGLIISKPKTRTISTIYKKLFQRRKDIENDLFDYQVFGPNLFNECLTFEEEYGEVDKIQIRPTEEVYPYLWLETGTLFNTKEDKIKENTWAIHWYNGCSVTKTAINKFNLNDDYVFNKYIRLILNSTYTQSV